jgi:hypothetical protein
MAVRRRGDHGVREPSRTGDLMSTDSGDYLVSAEGALEKALSDDVTEIVIRERTIGDGAETLEDLARALRDEASRYDRLVEDGWRLADPVTDGRGRCLREGDEAGPSGTAEHAGGSFDPDRGLAGVMEGARSLPDAAQALRRGAEAYEQRARDGAGLTEPVRDGQVSLDRS